MFHHMVKGNHNITLREHKFSFWKNTFKGYAIAKVEHSSYLEVICAPRTDMVTSIHENWFSARCLNTSKPAGEGVIVIQTSAFLLVAL